MRRGRVARRRHSGTGSPSTGTHADPWASSAYGRICPAHPGCLPAVRLCRYTRFGLTGAPIYFGIQYTSRHSPVETFRDSTRAPLTQLQFEAYNKPDTRDRPYHHGAICWCRGCPFGAPKMGGTSMQRSKSLMLGLAAALSFGFAGAAVPDKAAAEWQPQKPVEFIIMAGTGGGADQIARLMQGLIEKKNLSPRPFIPINKPGGSGAEAL